MRPDSGKPTSARPRTPPRIFRPPAPVEVKKAGRFILSLPVLRGKSLAVVFHERGFPFSLCPGPGGLHSQQSPDGLLSHVQQGRGPQV
jgi:hypothetical protein